MSADLDLSIVVAVKDGAGNLPAILAALGALPEGTELLLCVAGRLDAPPAGALVINAPEATLIPDLWRDGIRAARGRRVALTTSQCIPAPDWAGRIARADIDAHAGIGGAIDNDPAASPANWAIFFLRYSAFAPPLPAGPADEIAADNAVYDRAAILKEADLLDHGFWEPSFHRRFRAAGRTLLLDPALLVVHHGLVPARDFAEQRRAHGYEYGLERGRRGSTARCLALLALSPAVPPLILLRVVKRLAGRKAYRGHLLPAMPWLVYFAIAWARGEASGYLAALTEGRHTQPEPRIDHTHG
jgi:hypothetical protein